jgi:hypothetical protein
MQSGTTGMLICHWNGRFGNRMHQYAYGSEYAFRFNVPLLLPSEWEGCRLFEQQPHTIVADSTLRLYLNQTHPSLDNLPARAAAIARYNDSTGARFEYTNPDCPQQVWCGKPAVFIDSVCAYHPAIFNGMSAVRLRDRFGFSEEVRRTDLFRRCEDRQGTYDIAHLRRDDVSDPVINRLQVQGYSVLSKSAYFNAFKRYDIAPDEVQWISDDYTGRWHTNRPVTIRGGWSYPVGSEYLGPGVIFDWLEDFLKLYFARTIFRANSSFSWWAAFLSPTATVYSPVVDRRLIYGVDGHEEVEYEFVPGNHPHWMYGCDDIHFCEEVADCPSAAGDALHAGLC